MGKKKIDMTGYNDTPDWLGYCPDCPSCGTTMGYNYIESMFRCPNCGRTDLDDLYMDDYEEVYTDQGEEPESCKACGGPWPDCMTSCKIFDD